VIGFDDQVLVADSLWPGLTTVALPHYEMGRWAVRTLLEQIGSDTPPAPTHALLPCPVVRRGSVGRPPVQIRPAGPPRGEAPDVRGGELIPP
jgi:LacI family transcriptional regulator